MRTAQTLFNTDYGFCSPPRFAIGKPVAEYAGGGEISLNDKTELPPAEHHFFAISKILCGRQLICVIKTSFSAHCKTCAGGNSAMFFKLCSPPSALYIFSFNMAFAFVSPDLRWCSKRIPAVILRVLEKLPSKGENSNSILE